MKISGTKNFLDFIYNPFIADLFHTIHHKQKK